MADIQTDPAFQQVVGDLANRCMENGYAPTTITRVDFDRLLVEQGLITAPLGTLDATRQRNRIMGALHSASLREDEGDRLPFALIVADRKSGLYHLLPKPDFARERPSQHLAEIQRHHNRHKKELEKLLKSKLIAPEGKMMLVVYLAAFENSIESVRQTETKIMLAMQRGIEALEALGRQFAAEAAQQRINNEFSPLRALSSGPAIAAE